MAKIILADSYVGNVDGLGLILTQRGHEVKKIFLPNSRDFMEEIQQYEADVVLFEPVQFLKMYRPKGNPTLAEVMNDLEELDSKVILFTVIDAGDLPPGTKFPILQKPIPIDIVIEAIEKSL